MNAAGGSPAGAVRLGNLLLVLTMLLATGAGVVAAPAHGPAQDSGTEDAANVEFTRLLARTERRICAGQPGRTAKAIESSSNR
jgi:hypothetical protein